MVGNCNLFIVLLVKKEIIIIVIEVLIFISSLTVYFISVIFSQYMIQQNSKDLKFNLIRWNYGIIVLHLITLNKFIFTQFLTTLDSLKVSFLFKGLKINNI